jgi:hypothetical protein
MAMARINDHNYIEILAEIENPQMHIITIYEIGAISPFVWPGKELSVIHSMGNNFIVPMSYNNLKEFN